MPRHEADFVAVMRRKRNLDGEVQCRRGPQSNPTPPSKSQSVDPMAFPGDQPVASRQSYTVTDGRRSSPDRPDRVHRDHRDHPAQGRPRRRLVGTAPQHLAPSGSIRRTRVRTTRTSGSGPYRPRRRHVPRRAHRKLLKQRTARCWSAGSQTAGADRLDPPARASSTKGFEGSTTGVLRGRLIFTAAVCWS